MRQVPYLLIGLTIAVVVGCRSRPPATPAATPPPASGSPQQFVTPPPTAQPTQTVALTLAPRLEGDSLMVEGTTDLPDGALIAYEVLPKDVSVLLAADGEATVTGGKYSAKVNVKDWPVGSVEVWVAFQTVPASQPKDVLGRFGEHGEKMEGPNVTHYGSGRFNGSGPFKRVELTKTIALGRKK